MFERTANWIASVRAKETDREDSLFKDEFAKIMAGEIGQEIRLKSEEKSGGDNQFIVVRTKYIDDFINVESEEIPQIVILGAGFDTRALRLGLSKNNTVFEIDTPDLLAEKEKNLKSFDLNRGSKRVIVPSDLRDNWKGCLLAKGFNISIKTIWVAEGLFFYLSESIVRAIMKSIDMLSANGSKIIFDIGGTGLLTISTMSSYIKHLKESGLPLPYCTDYPEEILYNVGWKDIIVDYAGSTTASYGRIKTFEQDIQKGKRNLMNSYFVIGMK